MKPAHITIENALNLIMGSPRNGREEKLARVAQRLMQTLDGHNTGARADVAAILGVDDLKSKIGRES